MPRLKLTPNQRIEIVKLRDMTQLSASQIGLMFGVSGSYVARITKGSPREWIRPGRLSDEQVDEIRERYEFEPVTMSDLAADFGVSATHIGRIINFKQRKHTQGGS